MNQIDVDIQQTAQDIFANIETQLGISWGTITGDIASQTDLNNILNAKVNKTGDTISGVLTFAGTGQYNTTQVEYIIFQTTSEQGSVGRAIISLNASGVMSFKSVNSINLPYIRPLSNATYDCGSSALKWNTIYATKINNGHNIIVPDQAGTMVVATPPETDGTYVLKCTVQDGVKTYEWVEE